MESILRERKVGYSAREKEMSNSSLASSTNQRLDAARRMLAQSQHADEDWLTPSFETSSIFQLRSALNGLLQEVKSMYQLAADIDVTSLLEEGNTKGITVPVLKELDLLQADKNSWLSQLNLAYDIAFECRPNKAAGAVGISSNLIVTGSDSGTSTKYILNSLVEIVLRFREDAAEY